MRFDQDPGHHPQRPRTPADPRGPFRTIRSVEWTPTGNLVTFDECGHVGEKNATMTFKVGYQDRCFDCRGLP